MESQEDKSSSDKTEEASEERRKQFREEGNIASPKEIISASILIIFAIYFYFVSGSFVKHVETVFERAWLGLHSYSVTSENLMRIFGFIVKPIVPDLAFLLILCSVVPISIGLLFTKFNWTTKKMNFDLTKMNPVSGIKRIFSFQGLIELGKLLIKLTFFSVVIYFVFKSEIENSRRAYFLDFHIYTVEIGKSVFKLIFAMCIASLLIGAIDYAINLFKIEKDMKMTKQEVKDESKKLEGDPLVKSQRRRMARSLAMQKTIREVPKATFVVTNPDHFAIAIRYIKGMTAPVVVAKGIDFLALKMKEVAKNNDIVIVENKPLARALYKSVKVGQEIPPNLYQSIIEVMKYIYKIRGKKYFDKFLETSHKS